MSVTTLVNTFTSKSTYLFMKALLSTSSSLRTISLFGIVSVPCNTRSLHQGLSKTIKPLRILFCGSDEFSATSLERLWAEHIRQPNHIASINVVCKVGKLSGRGLKKIREVPIKNVVSRLGLPLHEIPTFTGWQPPRSHDEPINLIIAVSFGLLVPARILQGAEYGGLNLHPSLLPELHGPAPLQHTLMRGLKETGITLQTLHPKRFDHGTILAQQTLTLSDTVTRSFATLRDFMSPPAADLLVRSLHEGIFAPPVSPVIDQAERPESHAPKITPEDAHVNWNTWSSNRILQTQSAIGPLWSNAISVDDQTGLQRALRIQWHDLKGSSIAGPRLANHTPRGMPSICNASVSSGCGDEHEQVGGVWTADNHFLSPSSVTIEGRKKGWPGDSVQTMKYLLSLGGLPLG